MTTFVWERTRKRLGWCLCLWTTMVLNSSPKKGPKISSLRRSIKLGEQWWEWKMKHKWKLINISEVQLLGEQEECAFKSLEMWNAGKPDGLWLSPGETSYSIISKTLLDHEHHFLFYLKWISFKENGKALPFQMLHILLSKLAPIQNNLLVLILGKALVVHFECPTHRFMKFCLPKSKLCICYLFGISFIHWSVPFHTMLTNSWDPVWPSSVLGDQVGKPKV